MYIKVYSITREYYLCSEGAELLPNSLDPSLALLKTLYRSFRRLLLSKSFRIEYSFDIYLGLSFYIDYTRAQIAPSRRFVIFVNNLAQF